MYICRQGFQSPPSTTMQTFIEPFLLIGLAVRTTNENAQAGKDIPALWEKFMAENILDQIPNKIDSTIYCVYTDYEKDYTAPYTTLLACKVSSLDNIPAGMVGKAITGGNYKQIVAKGNILHGMVFDAWTKIWESDIPRAYTADFEVYGEKVQNPTEAEVDIFLALS